MTDADGSDANAPDRDPDFSAAWEEALADRSTKERIYEVATTLTEPTRVATVAERAACSTGGARTNLEWLAELGVVEQVADDPAMYQRNDAYFDFLRVYRLAQEHDAAALERLIEEYEEREVALADAFEADTPAEVDVLATAGFDELDVAYDRFSEWQTVRRRLRDVRRAKLLQQRDADAGGALSVV